MDKVDQVPQATASREQELLLEFLRERDAACPVCGYNVRALTRPVCPECRHELVLTVGATQPPVGWLLAALAPGFFSGIAAFFLLVPIIARVVWGDGVWMSLPLMVDLFGWCSGVFAIVLARKRLRFLAQSRARQKWMALAIWFVHVAALVGFIVIGVVYF